MTASPFDSPRLPHTAPPPALARELVEVAAAAKAFGEAIRAVNELPADFPKEPTRDIARALEALPLGTGEGAYEPLIYARNRLTALRRNFILTETATRDAQTICDAQTGSDALPPLTRGLAIDLTLTRLLADLLTALAAYRGLAARDDDERAEIAGTVRIDPTAPDVVAAADRARQTESALEKGAQELRAIIEPGSQPGDDLARQTQDAAGLVGLGRAELGMRKVVLQSLRRLAAAACDYPALMRKTAGLIQIGVDIGRPMERRWTAFQNKCTDAFFVELEGFARDMKGLADKREGERAQARSPSPPASKAGDFTIGKAMEMILRGEAPPAEWTAMIDFLDLSYQPGFRDVGVLSGLTALTSLNLSYTKVADVNALSGLTALTSLDLGSTGVADVSALSGLTALTSLVLADTQVTDVGVLSGLTVLTSLDLGDTKVADISALSGLTALTSLVLSSTQVTDVSALSGLTALTSLVLNSTQVADISALSGLTALTSLVLNSTQVADISALSGLTALNSLDLRRTKIADVRALKPLTQLTEIFVESRERRATLAATLGERGGIVKFPDWMPDA